MIKRILMTTVLLFSGLSFLPASANAHKILVFAYGDGPAITGEVTFSSGRKARDVEITVMDEATKKVLATTKTNDKGEFKFPIPQEAVRKKMNLLIVANVGDGHRGQWHMTAQDYMDSADEIATTASVAPANAALPHETAPAASPAASAPVPQPAAVTAVTEKQIEKIVERVMDRKLTPVKHLLAQACEPGPSVSDILGGIGYIIGLGGIVAYFKGQKKSAS